MTAPVALTHVRMGRCAKAGTMMSTMSDWGMTSAGLLLTADTWPEAQCGTAAEQPMTLAELHPRAAAALPVPVVVYAQVSATKVLALGGMEAVVQKYGQGGTEDRRRCTCLASPV